MRWLVITIVLILGVGWLAATADVAVSKPPRAADGWRRTAGGWQRMSDWPDDSPPAAGGGCAALHPALLMALQVLISIGALTAFAGPACGRRR